MSNNKLPDAVWLQSHNLTNDYETGWSHEATDRHDVKYVLADSPQRKEIEMLRKALQDIQKHSEINRVGLKTLPAPYDKGIAWYIADKALNPQPSKESSNPTGGISGTIEP